MIGVAGEIKVSPLEDLDFSMDQSMVDRDPPSSQDSWPTGKVPLLPGAIAESASQQQSPERW